MLHGDNANTVQTLGAAVAVSQWHRTKEIDGRLGYLPGASFLCSMEGYFIALAQRRVEAFGGIYREEGTKDSIWIIPMAVAGKCREVAQPIALRLAVLCHHGLEFNGYLD